MFIPVQLQTVATAVMDQTLERGAHKEMYAGKSVRRTDGRANRPAETHYRKKLEQTFPVRPSGSVVFSSLGEIIPQKS